MIFRKPVAFKQYFEYTNNVYTICDISAKRKWYDYGLNNTAGSWMQICESVVCYVCKPCRFLGISFRSYIAFAFSDCCSCLCWCVYVCSNQLASLTGYFTLGLLNHGLQFYFHVCRLGSIQSIPIRHAGCNYWITVYIWISRKHFVVYKFRYDEAA